MRRLAAALVLAVALHAAPSAAARSALAAENAPPGPTPWDVEPPAHPAIEGYASEASLPPGRSFHLHVRAPAGSRYRVEVYRLGWYGGDGGRLVRCLPSCAADRAAVAQPDPSPPDPQTGMVAAGWK